MKRPTILAFTPYALEGEGLGAAYHRSMSRLKDDEWGLLKDHDMMFLCPDWYRQLQEIIMANPQYSAFTCMTNRLSQLRPEAMQLAKRLPFDNHHIPDHYTVAHELQRESRLVVDDITKRCEEPGIGTTMGGVIILIKKTTWDRMNAMGNPKPLWTFKKLLTIDGKIHKRVCTLGEKLGLMKGVYVYHRYRHDGKKHANW